MQRVTELTTEPIVGKFYLVPCALSLGKWIPIHGPRHDDKEVIGFEKMHYHMDVRFISQRELNEEFDGAANRRGSLFMACNAAQLKMSRVLVAMGRVEEKRRKCVRAMPDYPTQVTVAGRPDWQLKLEAKYAAAIGCGHCPHRGFNLKDLPIKDGKVICPGHGLQWSVETGKLVKRV